MSILFRIDDFPGTKPEEFSRHNLDSLKLFDQVMHDNGVVEYYLGVIPKYTTDEHLEYFKGHPRIRVAIHGIDHDERFPNEFREWQTERDVCNDLLAVKSLWDTRVGPVDSYIPPHNVIDRRTVKALILAGFKTLFCGPGTDGGVMFDAEVLGLTVHNSLEGLEYGRSDELLARGNGLPWMRARMGFSKEACVCSVTLHFTWEVNIGLQNLDRFLKELMRPCPT